MPTFTPQPILTNQLSLAKQLLAAPSTAPGRVGRASPLADLLSGIYAGTTNLNAIEAGRDNETLRKQGLADALAAQDNASMAQALGNSQVPALQEMGLNLLVKDRAAQAAAARAAQMTPYQKATLDLRRKELENKGGLTEYQKRQLDLEEKGLNIRQQRADAYGKMLDNKEFGGGSGVTKAFRQKYLSAMQNGLSDEQAKAFASGMIAIRRDPLTGNTTAINKATGQPIQMAPKAVEKLSTFAEGLEPVSYDGGAQVTQVQNQPQQQAQQPQRTAQAKPQSKTLYDQADDATGAANTLRATASDVTEQFGVKVVSEATRRAQQDYKLAINELIRTLAINKRFPVAEMERIKGFLKPGMFVSSDRLKSEIEVLSQNLRESLATQQEIFKDTTFPTEDRKDAKRSIFAIERFLKKLGGPKPKAQIAGPKAGVVEGGYRFKGGDPSKPENWEKVQ